MGRTTPMDVLNELYAALKESDVYTKVTPNIFKLKKPLNFVGACIVINILPLTSNQLQICTLNVNYHVPNLINTTKNPVDNTQPDSITIENGSAIIDSVLADYWTYKGYAFKITDSTLIEDQAFNEWFVNFRVEYVNESETES